MHKLDAPHGGVEPGAVYNGRKEKDDTLKLSLAVGKELEKDGYDVVYTRIDDVFNSPYEKAMIANRSGADFFVSIHRNAMPVPNTASGVETLVYKNEGIAGEMAKNINKSLVEVGFADLGVNERPGLVVLRRTQMPSVLVEAGFIDNEKDNDFFDKNFDEIAKAIAEGVKETIQERDEERQYYMVQVGLYRIKELAEQLLSQLEEQGFPAFIVYDNGYYAVRVGAYRQLANAAEMEKTLRQYGYNTLIVKGEEEK